MCDILTAKHFPIETKQASTLPDYSFHHVSSENMGNACGDNGGFLRAALSHDKKEREALHGQHVAEVTQMNRVHQQQLCSERAFLDDLLRMYLAQKERVERVLPVWQLHEKCILEDKHQFEQCRLQERIKNLESKI